MTINVFEQVKPLLVFDSKDDFYHLQILKRKKENPELGSNSYVIKTYYITSIEHLDKMTPEIIDLCESNNARAGLNLNRRSFEKIAFQTLRKVSEQIFNKDFYSVRKSYNTCCGAFGNEKNKKWIIDIDDVEEGDMDFVNKMVGYILRLEPKRSDIEFETPEEFAQHRIKTILRTKNGYHIITSPFRLDVFKKEFPDIDVHKDNPMNLYIP